MYQRHLLRSEQAGFFFFGDFQWPVLLTVSLASLSRSESSFNESNERLVLEDLRAVTASGLAY